MKNEELNEIITKNIIVAKIKQEIFFKVKKQISKKISIDDEIIIKSINEISNDDLYQELSDYSDEMQLYEEYIE
ncbi:MAG: hypothetical protein KAI55_00100 [Candidatus Aenigmarchaeota archaeon]|nr:hypothetical protein [Candidatus Aenigmarchaeota archaeon]